jgi:hypothetical protein
MIINPTWEACFVADTHAMKSLRVYLCKQPGYKLTNVHIFFFSVFICETKRSAGQSAIASAAYRAGERLYSEYYGEYSDYTRKGGVICSDILLPSHAPPEYADRQTLSAI